MQESSPTERAKGGGVRWVRSLTFLPSHRPARRSLRSPRGNCPLPGGRGGRKGGWVGEGCQMLTGRGGQRRSDKSTLFPPSPPPPHQATTEGEAGKTKRWGEARDRVQCVDIDRQLLARRPASSVCPLDKWPRIPARKGRHLQEPLVASRRKSLTWPHSTVTYLRHAKTRPLRCRCCRVRKSSPSYNS